MPVLARHAGQAQAGASARSIVVAHAGRQHSHQLALALEAEGRLAGYWTGVPTQRPRAPGLADRVWRRLVPYAPVAVPRERVRVLPVLPALVQTTRRLTRPAQAAHVRRWGEQAFDRWAAWRLQQQLGLAAVVAYENTARFTFAAARRQGLVTILDAASVHHTEQDRLFQPDESAALHRRIVADKDAEIRLADYILCVSEVARESYLAAGVPAAKVGVVTLGADLDLFCPARAPTATRKGHVFGFLGNLGRGKGGDVLLDALARVRRETPDAQLVIIGRVHRELEEAVRKAGATRVGHQPQAVVAQKLQTIDTLVLPSRFESFGMAVAEALACGVPVIVSDRVGAKDLIEQGVSGWVVPVGDATALAAAMRHAITAIQERPAAVRQAARAAAEQASWEDYRRRVVRQLAAWVPL